MTALDAAGGLARARHDELDPLGPRGNHFDRRRFGRRKRVADRLQQRRGLHRLVDVLECLLPHRLQQRLRRVVRGHDDDARPRFAITQLREQIEAVHARHPDVEQQQVEPAAYSSALSASTPSLATDVVNPAPVRTLLSTRRVVLSSSTTRILFMMAFAFAWESEVCAWLVGRRAGPRDQIRARRTPPRAVRSRGAASRTHARRPRSCSSGPPARLPQRPAARPMPPTVAIAPFSPCAASRSASESRRRSARSIRRRADG